MIFVFPNLCFLCDSELEYGLIGSANPENRRTLVEMVRFSLDSLSSRRRRGPLSDGLHIEEENLSLLGVCMLVCCLAHHPGQKSFAGFSIINEMLCKQENNICIDVILEIGRNVIRKWDRPWLLSWKRLAGTCTLFQM